MRAPKLLLQVAFALTVAADACAASEPVPLPQLVTIPAGPFLRGSDRAERETAYALDEAAYGHQVTRRQRWYESEYPRAALDLDAYQITVTSITNSQYRAFVRATGHRVPDVDAAVWQSYGLIHPYDRIRRHAWADGEVPPGREDHPVVLVSRADARAYAAWLSRRTGGRWRLPWEAEWEKAVRGTDGRTFPWGDAFRPDLLNSHDSGPFDTLPVGPFPAGAGPSGLLDGTGQVFEWTRSEAANGRAVVKGGSWDDKGCGVCRPAARDQTHPDRVPAGPGAALTPSGCQASRKRDMGYRLVGIIYLAACWMI